MTKAKALQREMDLLMGDLQVATTGEQRPWPQRFWRWLTTWRQRHRHRKLSERAGYNSEMSYRLAVKAKELQRDMQAIIDKTEENP